MHSAKAILLTVTQSLFLIKNKCKQLERHCSLKALCIRRIPHIVCFLAGLLSLPSGPALEPFPRPVMISTDIAIAGAQEYNTPWWRHQMETFSALLALCAGNSLVTGEFPTQRPVTLSFDVFFDLRLNKRLRKQSWGWWFETPSCSLWRHCNASLHRWHEWVCVWHCHPTMYR